MAFVHTTIIPQIRLELRAVNNVTGTPSFQIITDDTAAITIFAPRTGATSHESLAAAVQAFNDAFNGPAPVAKLEAAE